MTRTTLDLDPAVLRELRELGAREDKSMSQVASEILARALADEPTIRPAAFEWISRDLGTPVVDLEDKEAIRAILDS